MQRTDRLVDALDFDAPYVIDRLLKDGVSATPAQARQLFTEAKRYLVLCEVSPGVSYGMYSAVVDAAWHTFILFTAEYTDYGNRYFGGYVHHAPAVGSGPQHGMNGLQSDVASFDDFRQRYEEVFGEPLPDVWYDETSVTTGSRVINDSAGRLALSVDHDTVVLSDDTAGTILSANALAFGALDFIARQHDFYVREISGDLTDDEKVAVVQPLVRAGVLRVAS